MVVMCVVWWLAWWLCFCFFFFKQKTAYEMRISDWSSDVCSSDLLVVLTVYGLQRSVRGESHLSPFILALILVFLGYSGLGISLWPYIKIGRASCRERVCQYV